MKVTVKKFTSVPESVRSGVGGRKAEWLESLRNLQEGEMAEITRDDPNEDFEQFAERRSGSIRTASGLAYRPRIRINKESGSVEVYRVPGSEYASKDGSPVLGKNNRRMTVADVKKQSAKQTSEASEASAS